MGVTVAEYLGMRTDVDYPVIAPVTGQVACPFSAAILYHLTASL